MESYFRMVYEKLIESCSSDMLKEHERFLRGLSDLLSELAKSGSSYADVEPIDVFIQWA